MLAEARWPGAGGLDVVVGLVETYGWSRTEEQPAGQPVRDSDGRSGGCPRGRYGVGPAGAVDAVR